VLDKAGACNGAYTREKANRATYDVLGGKVTSTAAGSNPTAYGYGYNVNGQTVDDIWLHRQVNHDGTWTEFTYDVLGRVTSIASSTGAATGSTYDAFARATAETQTVGGVQVKVNTVTYDSLGWALTSTDNIRHLATLP
jgi:YD repeat-containing protein